MAQHLRRSQFITTYGPGAILEGPDGPKIIPSLQWSALFAVRQPVSFEITDKRLSDALLGGAGILRLPSNAELGVVEKRWIYDTKRFPSWSLCVRHKILYQKTQNDNLACPQCTQLSSPGEAWSQANRQAIRFVRACPAGHLDDVDWIHIIPHGTRGCSPGFLRWEGGGGALRNIEIKCPICGMSRNLGEAYATEWDCSGRLPEREPVTGSQPVRPGCSLKARIMQRGAANLRIPEIQTALTIPPRADRLHRLLEMMPIQYSIIANPPSTKQALMVALANLVNAGRLPQAVVDEIDMYAELAILDAISHTVSTSGPTDLLGLRREEFAALKDAATNGHPPQPSSQPGGPPQFEIIQSQVRTLAGPGAHLLRITPVNRLRVVMVQTGYRRVPGGSLTNSSEVECVFHDGQRQWYTGVELFGEGIFIDLNTDQYPRNDLFLAGRAAAAWTHAWTAPQFYLNPMMLHPGDKDQLHPVFVWWHTFSHRLINALAVDSGYSSASVRERVYIDVTPGTGGATGGILLYTAQPGGDGTLGGLIALVPDFQRVLDVAFRNLDACSNDPLCGEERFGPGKYNGAACYACSLVSETSCEHRNMRLDRQLLLDNLP